MKKTDPDLVYEMLKAYALDDYDSIDMSINDMHMIRVLVRYYLAFKLSEMLNDIYHEIPAVEMHPNLKKHSKLFQIASSKDLHLMVDAIRLLPYEGVDFEKFLSETPVLNQEIITIGNKKWKLNDLYTFWKEENHWYHHYFQQKNSNFFLKQKKDVAEVLFAIYKIDDGKTFNIIFETLGYPKKFF